MMPAPEGNPAGPAHAVALQCRRTTAASMALNGVPCIDSLSVTTPGRLSGATVEVRIDGHDAPPWLASVEAMPDGGSVELDASGFSVPTNLLRRSNERETFDVVATLLDRSGATLARDLRPLVVLPASHWVGRHADAPSLAAFVTPNSPVAHELLRHAAAVLGASTGSPSLDGYQSGSPDRAQRIAQACFEALAARRVSYQAMQASFEDEGQKVRALADVVNDGLGNCLDMSVAVAALLEAAGLVVVLVAADGHAVVGFSTVGEPFPEAVHEGASALINRIELGEVRLVESTIACAGGGEFGDALTRAEQWVRDVKGNAHVIDLHAARRAGYHPLPEVIEAEDARTAAPGIRPDATPSPRTWEVRLPPHLAPVPARQRSLEEARLDGWKRRLLDLTLRNRLLNDRADSGIPLLSAGEPTLAMILARLLGETTFRLLPHGGVRTPSEQALSDEIGRQWLRSALPEADLAKRATKAWRDAVSSIEETGARSLFVALGFLQFQAEGRSAPVRAPLLLVPAELVRSGRSEGFRVRAVGEDIVANAALIEHLRVVHGLDLGLLNDLTEDDAKIDVPTLLAHVRQRVRDLPGAVVHADAKLGNYSFKKLPLFHELRDRSAQVVGHPVVRSLLERRATAAVSREPLVTPEATDAAARLATMRLPLPADSSQLAAVASGAEGRTFVLQGPPGTGKSQTITNLLAECLARGKRVLFIAEKAAALEVVSRRLHAQGLGRFALDLHAEHASKTSFVAQVKAALEDLPARAEPGARKVSGVGADLDRLRGRLRAACDALHGPCGIPRDEDATGHDHHDGMSVFRAIERVHERSEDPARAAAAGIAGTLDAALPESPSEDDVQVRRDAVADLAAAVRVLPEGVAGHLADFAPRSPIDADAARATARDAATASRAAASCEQAMANLARALGCPPPSTLGEALECTSLAGWAEASHPAWAELVEMACDQEHAAKLERHAEAALAARRARALAAELDKHFDREVLGQGHAAWMGDLREARGRSFLARWWVTRRVRKGLARFSRRPWEGDIEVMLAALEQIGETASALALAASFETELRTLGERAGSRLEPESTLAAIERAHAMAKALRASHRAHLPAIKGTLPKAIRAGGLAALAVAARAALEAMENAAPVVASTNPSPPLLTDDARLASVRERLSRLADHAGALPAWSDVSVARERATALGMTSVANALVSGRLAPEVAPSTAEAEMLAGWVRSRMRATPALGDCPSERMEPLRATLARWVKAYQDGVPKALPAVVRDRIREAFAPEKAEPGLRHALRLLDELRVLTTIRRPIRRLMREGAPAVTVLMPLVLASPLTAATLLPPDFPTFDLVVFDEASQVPVWDAACALSRARAAVIVGDSRQLPPTNFFERRDPGTTATGGGGDLEDPGVTTTEAGMVDSFEVLDSLLDEAVASGLPELRLLWHYRSRDERLIEFSNRKSYEGRLKTFPSAVRTHPNLGVEFRFVGGIYDRGGQANNPKEAQAVVDEVRRRLLDPEDCPANRSIGVVTFSEAQQSLVQDLLDEATMADEALGNALHQAALSGEGVFVKNLENVQGDERATMIFSMAYGPDPSGRLHHHFGPLSQAGGERRLNVAVTRAREKVVVISSIRAADIDLSRCTAQGARDLRDYLAYAEHGTLPAVRGMTRPEPVPDPSVLERRLADALSARGWHVALHVGASRDYRVGVAIARRDVPGQWLLGVELDGLFHRAAPAVLDRDVVRGHVLCSLGWEILRVSCIDMFRDPNAVVARVEQRLLAMR